VLSPPAGVASPLAPHRRRRVQRIGLVAGPLLFAAAWAALPASYTGLSGETVAFGHAGRATAGVALWMGAWWLSEAISVYATALLPLVVLPLVRARSMQQAASPYANELIFLFMGGFLLALAMQRWGLHRRIALVALRLVGDRPINMVGGFMAITAVLSMWVSNTATAIMMLPVATSVIDLVARQVRAGGAEEALSDPGSSAHAFALALLLGVAYASSIGGIATPIGTPPNLFLLSFVQTHLGREISFLRWMTAAVPLVVVFLVLTWLLLTRVLHPIRLPRIEGGAALVRRALAELGPLGRGEAIVFVVFVLTSALWIGRPVLSGLSLAGVRPLAGLSDAGIAMLAAMVLFVAPVDRRAGRFALEWDSAAQLPWGILVLFGGGLSLADAIQANGVGELLGAQVAAFAGVPTFVILVCVVTGIVFLTELTSNTATTAALVPILAALAPGLGIEPLELIVPAAVAASCAFMLPVATPPNAVVFGTGLVSAGAMARAGFWLNWIGVVLVTLFTYALAMPLLAGR
jgi:solute carrier family 13 (sodium-dependent dicarboxylate transporter), member 2/3/5